ncbi:hypothetical protein BJX99DRAFT_149672 [Aspergillus californicus]
MSVVSPKEEKPQLASIKMEYQTDKDEDEEPTPTARPQLNRGILLDLSYATPQKPIAGVGLSPALKELQGLEFTQNSEPQDSPSGIKSARKLDFGDVPQEEGEPTGRDGMDPIDEELAENYRREIDMICRLMERATLSETFKTKLIECKGELEFRLSRPRSSKPDKEQSQEPSDPQATESPVAAPKPPKSEAATSRAPAPVTPTPKTLGLATDENTPRCGGGTSSTQTGTPPSSQSQLNAAALPFSPDAFTQHRSLSNATSTDSSTALLPTPSETPIQAESEVGSNYFTADEQSPQFYVKNTESLSPESTVTVRLNLGDNHMIGDHLLPGRGAREVEARHLYGDHVLPGRGPTKTSIACAASVSSFAAAPKPAPPTFTCPQPLAQNLSNAKEPKSLCLPLDTKQPKLTPRSGKSNPLRGGLQISRYAQSKWV